MLVPKRFVAICFTVFFFATSFVQAELKDLPREGFDFFEKNIRPVLSDKCFKCHSEESEKLKGALKLDSKAALLKGGDSGPAIVPFHPETSLLIKAIHWGDPDLQMPPKEKLTAHDIKNFEIWIKMGAPDPRQGKATNAAYGSYNWAEVKKFWAFQPIKHPKPPQVKNATWPVTAIDNFVLAKLEERNLVPNGLADKRTLIRRATYDLIGLPPAPEEVKAFLDDKSPKAFEKVIDRLLASPHYGEQWGRHWLDVVRYADTSGDNSDFPIPDAYKYRNYVIDSFNADKPYDVFIREQIAGDLLPAKNEEEKFQKVIATGYLAIARRFGSRANEFHLTIEDTIDNVGKGILGLSVSCARCHDHKFDPIPTKDYYSLYGIFESTKYAFPGTEIYRHPKDSIPLASGTNLQAVVDYEKEAADLDEEIDKLGDEKRELAGKLAKDEADEKKNPDAKEKLDEDETKLQERLQKVKADLEDARTKLRKLEYNPPDVEKAFAVTEGKPTNAKIQKKGSPTNLGEEAPRGFLTILGGQKLPKEEKGSGRLALAEWLTEPQNPLTARVIANRIWQFHFGKGLVETPNDFGARGKMPSDPELLDFLATELVRKGWSFKKMHKAIMLSRVYQLSSAENGKNNVVDPENSWHWRFNRRRLSAEEIRDSLLTISGTLDTTMGGAQPFPAESDWKFSQHKPFIADYPSNKRSIYLMQQRIRKQPFLEVFDGADPNATTGERPISTTPIQALMMMNSPYVFDTADKFAVRIGLATFQQKERIDYAFQLVFGRAPSKAEVSDGISYLNKIRGELRHTKLPADQQARGALASYARVLFSSNEFFFID
ncbi:MAG: hypothetical protein JWM68_4319 [Verrucomicrobiales bacterium]|nr:hypothetical protein [Verrucomicrobiales bacterium]